MSRRRVEVEVTTTVIMEFDDEAVSDWDGRALLHVHENPERFLPGSTLRDSLAAAAVTIGLWGSRDGWADFDREALWASTSADAPDIGRVTLDGRVVI
jgi:hypothetical protein